MIRAPVKLLLTTRDAMEIAELFEIYKRFPKFFHLKSTKDFQNSSIQNTNLNGKIMCSQFSFFTNIKRAQALNGGLS